MGASDTVVNSANRVQVSKVPEFEQQPRPKQATSFFANFGYFPRHDTHHAPLQDARGPMNNEDPFLAI
jgi:hypothetical protein